jgi:hypothetical protein
LLHAAPLALSILAWGKRLTISYASTLISALATML